MSATPAIDQSLIVVIINRSWSWGMSDAETYKCAQGEWLEGDEARLRARLVVAVAGRIVVGVFDVDQWSATRSGEDVRGRAKRLWAFEGSVARDYQHLVGTRMDGLPDSNRSSFLKYLDGYHP